jgi:DNA polymerase
MNEEKRLYYLDQMGVQVWVPQDSVELVSDEMSKVDSLNLEIDKPGGTKDVKADISLCNLEELKLTVANCMQCELHRTRTQTVFGKGHPAAEWLIIGEAPGADEDKAGEPFAGKAGQLLTSMLRAMGLAREEVYIANVLKCRPPNNRDPKSNEITSCSSYLRKQIELIQPKIILVVGRIAAQSLLNSDMPIGKMRGQKYLYQDTKIPVVATYHPAYLLRSPQQKRNAWEDLKYALELYAAQ